MSRLFVKYTMALMAEAQIKRNQKTGFAKQDHQHLSSIWWQYAICVHLHAH